MTTKIMQRLAGKVSVVIMVALLTAAMGTYGLLKGKHGSTTHAAATASKQAAMAAKLPLVFEPNLGQTDGRVKFVARSSGYVTFLTGPSQAVLKIQNDAAGQSDVVTMNLAGANAKAQGGAIDKTSGVSNYYIGNDRSKWLEQVPNYAKVRYNDVYPGVDVVYQGDDSRFRYDFVVKPGADPNAIRNLATEVVAVGQAVHTLDDLPASAGWKRMATPPSSALWTDNRSDIVSRIKWAGRETEPD